MIPRARLADLTTIRLGGPADTLVEATSDDQVIETVAQVDDTGQPLLVLGAGSNVVVADAEFSGTVLRIATRGIDLRLADGHVRLAVAAGECWREVVMRATSEGLSGIECLAGIPGTTGATPIQNVGAYGQQVSDAIVSVRAYDRRARRVIEIDHDRCGFTYRSSVFRCSARYVILSVNLDLERSQTGRPVGYTELASRLQVAPGARAPLVETREAVLDLRRQKGMVLDPADPDSISVGSFFVNPILSSEFFAELAARVAQRLGHAICPPQCPRADGRIKTSAAWLIERAGFPRGFGDGRVGISTKHTLALVNRGGATTDELVTLARQISLGVERSFGVALVPEPTLVGVEL